MNGRFWPKAAVDDRPVTTQSSRSVEGAIFPFVSLYFHFCSALKSNLVLI
jgi:hypothetical protein